VSGARSKTLVTTGKTSFHQNSNNTVIFMGLRAIQYERRLKYKSAFIIQKNRNPHEIARERYLIKC